MRSEPIPRFALYGEQTPLAAAEPVHIELIGTRSRLYDWHIAPHTHSGMYQVLFLFGGTVRASVDAADWACRGPVAITVHPSVVHGFAFSEQAHGFVLTLDQNVFAGAQPGQGEQLFAPLFLQPLQIDLAGATGAAPRIEALLQQLLAELTTPQQGHALMLDWLARAALLLLLRQQQAHHHADQSGRGEFDTYHRLRDLVEAHYLEQWSVARYADALHLTESRLNRMCVRLGGKSAFDLAQQRLMLEARRKLLYVPGTVASIAYELGFQDPAYFSRAFKRVVGMTPNQYRQQPQRNNI